MTDSCYRCCAAVFERRDEAWPTAVTDALLRYLSDVMKHDRLLQHVTGNPRSLKRICNIVMLSLHCYPPNLELTKQKAFTLLLIIIMVEQWPFR